MPISGKNDPPLKTTDIESDQLLKAANIPGAP